MILEKKLNNPFVNSVEKSISDIYKPMPSDRELDWDKSRILLSKTDIYGTILYANEAFVDVSGYDDYELIKQPHSIVRHPDMPKVIFKWLWKSLQAGENYNAIIKNMSKTGRYYWVVTDFKAIKDDKDKIISYLGKRKSVPENIVVKFIDPLYKKMLQIEKISGLEASEQYLIGFLEERGKTFMEYTQGLIETGVDSFGKKEKRGFFSSFFKRVFKE